MRFGSPEWLYFLAALPGLWFLNRYLLLQSKRRLENFVTSSLWNTVLPDLNWSVKNKKAFYALITVGLILMSLARPQWGKIEEDVKITGLDILILLDLSQSMATEDVLPSRLSKAKHFVRSILDRIGNDRVGIIGFAGTSYLASPLTTDTDYVREVLETLDPSSIQNQGTDIGLALETAKRAFERGAENPQDTSTELASQVLILLSDGESHEAAADQVATELGKSGVRVLVVGIGTEKGGPIPIRDARGELQGHKRGPDNQPVISQFNADVLRGLSKQANGLYWDMSPSGAEVDEMANEINRLQRTDLSDQKRTTYHERFQWPLAAAIVVLLIQLLLRESKSKKSVLGILLYFTISSMQYADASSLHTYLENNKGVQAREEGKLQDAIQHFGNAQAVDPGSPELLFNQGTILLDQKNIPDAITGFEQSAHNAIKMGNPGLAARSLFNLGTAHQLNGKSDQAIQAYLRAIESAHNAKDIELENEARKRLQSIYQKNNQSQQNQGSQSDEKNQNSNSKGDNQSSKKEESKSDQKNPKDDSKNQEPKKFEDPGKSDRKKQFESQQMSKEDAEKVMSELAGKERELQKKFQRQGVRQKSSEKDW